MTNIEQSLSKIDKQIKQLQNRQKKLLNQQKEKERKERTRRLIERGAILESLLPNPDQFSNDQIKTLLETIMQMPQVKSHLQHIQSKIEPPSQEQISSPSSSQVPTQAIPPSSHTPLNTDSLA